MATVTKNDQAWQELFDKYHILDEIKRMGRFEIEAGRINTVREARLMAKFDHYVNLPQIFKENQLTIFPISRSRYVIGKFEAYLPVKYDGDIEIRTIQPPALVESIEANNLYSESLALNYAQVSGMMDEIAGGMTYHTISGRMSTQSFDFKVRNVENGSQEAIRVDNSQCEIDGGYESGQGLLIVEAKNYTVEDFLIRQLYYPFRLWAGKLKKPVTPVFMTFSNDCFTFFVFTFDQLDEYNSIRLIGKRKYLVGSDQITMNDIYGVFQNSLVKDEPAVPFPQADKMERVVDLLGLLYENDLSKEAITENYQFDIRQTDYYTNAAIYLGLVDKEKNQEDEVYYALTELGRRVMSLSFRNKYLGLVQRILEHEVFYKVIRKYFERGVTPEKSLVCNIMRESSIYGVNPDSHSTIERRAQTILSWVEWIMRLRTGF